MEIGIAGFYWRVLIHRCVHICILNQIIFCSAFCSICRLRECDTNLGDQAKNCQFVLVRRRYLADGNFQAKGKRQATACAAVASGGVALAHASLA